MIKFLPDYPRYAVDDLGNVYSTQRKKLVKLTPGLNVWGYKHVKLSNKVTSQSFAVHLLILKTFKGDRSGEGLECRHRNGIKTDNRLENLTWGTKSENQMDRIIHRVHNTLKLTPEQVLALREDVKSNAYSHRQLAAKYNIDKSQISRIANRKTWKHI